MIPTIAVIGAGKWGFNVIRTCYEAGALRLVADTANDRLAAVRLAFPDICTTLDAGELMRSEVDAVAIATNAPSHVALALEAIRNGKDVFVEKPLALTVIDAEKVAAAAERHGRKVFVGHLLLYHPAVRALRAAIAEGRIGSVMHLRSRRLGPGRIRTHENVWWSFAPHDVAVMLELLGQPDTVTASQFGGVQPGIADFAYADFQFEHRRSAHIEVAWLDPEKSSRIDVFGTQGVLTVETARAEAMLTYWPLTIGKPDHATIPIAFGRAENTLFPAADPLRDELESFLDWIAGGPTPPTDVQQGLRVVRTLAATDTALRAAQRDPLAPHTFAAALA